MAYYSTPKPSQLSEKEKRILEDKEKDIVELMNPLKVTKFLLDKGVIDETDRTNIIQQVVVRDQIRVLLGMIPMRGADAFVQFVKVLDQSGTENHAKLARILRNDEPFSLQANTKFEENQYAEMNESLENHETRIKSLEKEAKEGKNVKESEFLKAELELKTKELAEIKQQLEDCKGQLKESEEEKDTLRKKIEDLECEIKTLTEKHDKQMQSLEDGMNKKFADQDRQMQDLARAVKKLNPRQQPMPRIKPRNRFEH